MGLMLDYSWVVVYNCCVYCLVSLLPACLLLRGLLVVSDCRLCGLLLVTTSCCELLCLCLCWWICLLPVCGLA